ncbi:glycosyltransferase [Oxynema sp. CENA135]|uniref:glycosyltransferase family 2 protein n=1 Tax=Oxynema sp. CENA135 TaxID=984206 RepID=UPI00190A4EEC|nr:glycosyltransferase [Oxynema sp. CENA135]MBK4730577.1 glycosyltransferase [Oxynema sp. CENA135]
MQASPLVSILINNYNYDRFLKQAISSALNQTYKNVEVIVVDDGSTDGSREIIAEYGDRIVAVLKENGGQASAFNAGFAASHGEIICFLDADDLCLPHKGEAVVSAFRDRPEMGWCFHSVNFMETQKIEDNFINFIVPKIPDLTVESWDLRDDIRRGSVKNFPYPPTSGLCFRRSLLAQILPMPETEKILLNDSYLIFTAMGLSAGIFLPHELGWYRIHQNNAYGSALVPGSADYAQKNRQKQQRKCQIRILTGYWIYANFPQFINLSNYLIAAGLGIGQHYDAIQPTYQELIDRHLASISWRDRFEIYLRAIYLYLKQFRELI